jgi:hypothetical protein
MKKIVLSALIFGLLLSSCSPLQIATSEGQQVTPIVEESTPAGNLPAPSAVPDVSGFEERLMMALTQRNAEQLRSLMDDNFIIAHWQSEGTTYPANEAITQLIDNYLGSQLPVTLSDFDGLPGFDAQSMVGPDVAFEKAIFVRNWGAEGKDEALLIIARRGEGTFYWHSVLVIPGGLSQPETEGCSEPVDVSAADGTISYNGISFTISPDLATAMAVKTCPAVQSESGQAPDQDHPAYTSFFFPTYNRQNVDFQPELRIYEVAADMSQFTFPLNMLGELQTALTDRPDLLSWFDAAPLHVKQKYLDFANGAGVRGLVQYMQDRFFYTNNGLMYEFNGITQDGRYVVVFRYPVTVAFLMDLANPDPSSNTNPSAIQIPEWPSNYEQQLPIIEAYNTEALLRFEQMGDDGAFPNLALLDALVQSLQINIP